MAGRLWHPAAGALLALLGASSVEGVVRAQVAGTVSARRSVELSIVGAVDDELADTVRELLGRLGIRLVPATASTDDELARVEIDLDPSGIAKVVVYDVMTSGVVLRRTIPKNTSPSIFRDEVAHAVDEAIQSELLVDQDRAAARAAASASPSASSSGAPPAASVPSAAAPPAAAPPAPPPMPPPPEPEQPAATPVERDVLPTPRARPSSALAVDVTTLAGGGPFASQSPVVARVEGGVSVALRRWLRPSAALSVAYVVPFGPSSEVVDYHANVVSFRVMPGLEPLHSSHLGLGVSAGVGVDVLSVAPGTNGSDAHVTVGSATTREDPVLSVALTGAWGIASGVALTLKAVCDFDLANRHYYEDTDGTRSDIFVPWNVRPMLVAGFTFTAVGHGLFAAGGPR